MKTVVFWVVFFPLLFVMVTSARVNSISGWLVDTIDAVLSWLKPSHM